MEGSGTVLEVSLSSYDGYAMRTIPEPPDPPGCPLVDAGEEVTYTPPPPEPVFSSEADPGFPVAFPPAFPAPAQGVVPGPPAPVPPSGDGLGP